MTRLPRLTPAIAAITSRRRRSSASDRNNAPKYLHSARERFFRPGHDANLVSNWIPTLGQGEAESWRRGDRCRSALSSLLLRRLDDQGLYRTNSLCHHPAIAAGVEMIVAREGERGIFVVLDIVNRRADEITLNSPRSKSTDD